MGRVQDVTGGERWISIYDYWMQPPTGLHQRDVYQAYILYWIWIRIRSAGRFGKEKGTGMCSEKASGSKRERDMPPRLFSRFLVERTRQVRM